MPDNQFDEIAFRLNEDILNQYFQQEHFLRPIIETVFENFKHNSSQINALEVSQSSAVTAQTVIQTLRLLSSEVEINYSLLHPMAEQISEQSSEDIISHKWEVQKSQIPPGLNSDVVIYEDTIDWMTFEFNVDLKILFDSLWNAVKDNGFLIVINKSHLNFAEEVLSKVLSINKNGKTHKCLTNEVFENRHNHIVSEALRVGFTTIATKFDGISKKSLIFRKSDPQIKVENQTFIRITDDKCEQWINELQNSLQIITNRPNTENIWLIGNDSPTNGIIGLANCLRKEPNGHRIRCIFQYDSESNAFDVMENRDLLEKIVKKDLFVNVLKSESIWGSFRRFSINSNENLVQSEHCYLDVQTRGDLSSFKWFEAQHKYWPLVKKANQHLVNVFYSALNFKDVMYASGQ